MAHGPADIRECDRSASAQVFHFLPVASLISWLDRPAQTKSFSSESVLAEQTKAPLEIRPQPSVTAEPNFCSDLGMIKSSSSCRKWPLH